MKIYIEIRSVGSVILDKLFLLGGKEVIFWVLNDKSLEWDFVIDDGRGEVVWGLGFLLIRFRFWVMCLF